MAAPEGFRRDEAMKAGCDAYIVKPIDTRKLPEQVAAVAARPSQRILIIEDDPKTAHTLKIRFESDGYDTAMTSDALLGASLALQAQPNLIILDIGLPDRKGLQLAKKFQGQPETQHTPIIFVTASQDPNLRERAMEMRIVGLFDKPYDPEELLAAARYALGKVVPRQPPAPAQPEPDPLCGSSEGLPTEPGSDPPAIVGWPQLP